MVHRNCNCSDNNNPYYSLGKLIFFIFAFLMCADCVLTLIGFYYFDYSRFNPYTIWIFQHLHWSVWVIGKIIAIVLTWILLNKVHKVYKAITYLFIIPIMIGAVLYDIDAIFNTTYYMGSAVLLKPIAELPVIREISNFLWGIYAWF